MNVLHNLENYVNICLSAQLCPTLTVITKPCTCITKPVPENNSYSSLKVFQRAGYMTSLK